MAVMKRSESRKCCMANHGASRSMDGLLPARGQDAQCHSPPPPPPSHRCALLRMDVSVLMDTRDLVPRAASMRAVSATIVS